MSVMYFSPSPEDIARAKSSNCPLATPRDARDCQGSKCGSWNLRENKPCPSFKGAVDYSVEAVMIRYRKTQSEQEFK